MRVAVANDYDLIVAGLEAMLSPLTSRVNVCAAITVGDEIPDPVDIVLYDTFGRTDDGVVAIKQLLTTDGVGKVAVFTGSPRPAQVAASIEAGASAVLAKSRSARSLVDALVDIYHGERVVDSAGGGPFVAPWPGAARGLSARQSEVVALLLQGLSNAEIASALYVDVNTVKTHLRHAYRALGVHTRSQALALLLGEPDGFSRATPVAVGR
ncbi:MAG: response regulator transcription factor [Acidimicrobiia bacterium]|nr:response regulator transcription factor [Acidimicrobiia bacterium]